MSGPDRWQEAMDFWKSQPECIRTIIRNCACEALVADGAEEVGSSDVNHQIYHFYIAYDGCKEHYTSFLAFLVDEMQEYA